VLAPSFAIELLSREIPSQAFKAQPSVLVEDLEA
jgi:hypothetical protein